MPRRRPPPPPKKPGVRVTQEAAGSESPEPPPPPPPKSPQRHKASRRLPRDDAAEEVFEKVKTLRGMPALSSGIFDILRDEPPPPPPPPPVRPRSQRSGMGIATPPRAPEKERRRFGPTRTSLGIPQQPPPPPPQPPRPVAMIPACPRCVTPMLWVGQHQRWFCSVCRAYL
ncbi:MAG: hypothetical protein KC468_17370 [Myxococcales bacterium]|nr:hypothetical protein [Myxococcales bacterium]